MKKIKSKFKSKTKNVSTCEMCETAFLAKGSHLTPLRFSIKKSANIKQYKKSPWY